MWSSGASTPALRSTPPRRSRRTSSGKVLGFTPEGTLAFSTRVGEGVIFSPALGADGLLRVPTSDGRLVTLSRAGETVGEVMLGGRLNAPTIAEDGTLYVTTFEGKALEAVRTRSKGLARGGWPSFAGLDGRRAAKR